MNVIHRTQKGGSVVSLIITLIVVGIGAYIAIQVIPQRIEAGTMDNILDEIKRLLKKDGVAYITVRADVETGVTSKGTYQRKVKLPYEKVWENQSFVTYKVTKEQL